MAAIELSPDVEAVRTRVVATRRDLHQHPELAFEEVRTAGVVAGRLRELGLDPRTGIAQTGVTALIEGAAGDGPTILLRADMDALPIEEANDVAYRSQVPGKMHACGHDGHTAILLGVAEVLLARRERLRGRVKLCFQPAEETRGGAKPMIEAGVLDAPAVDAVFGLHLWAPEPTGTVSVGSGPIMASSDVIEIAVQGVGGHAAMPAETTDPVVVSAHLITALQTLVSRNVSPAEAAVVSITRVQAGETFNVIPDSAHLLGTVRTLNPNLRSELERRMAAMVSSLALAFGAQAELSYRHGYPVTVNDAGMADLVRAAAAGVVGEGSVLPVGPVMGAEDFAYFLQEKPGCFFMVGIKNEAKGTGAPHHNPHFDLDEDALAIGVETMVRVAERALAP